MSRVILFAEVPGFYAMVARSDDPGLVDRPVIVGGDPRKRGLVQSASEEALAAGVTLEMPVIEALRLCPRARAVRTDMARYREVSRRLFASLRAVFPRLEPFGLGAAYLDLTHEAGEPTDWVDPLRERVRGDLGLPMRIGIASSKFLARVAALEAGQGGSRWVAPDEERAFLHPLPTSRLDGVGRKTASRLAEMGARTIGDVVTLGRGPLEEAFGTHGLRIHDLANLADDAPVRAAAHPQSLSREVTLADGSLDLSVLGEHLHDLAQQLEAELRLQRLAGARVTLKVRYVDQIASTRSVTLGSPVSAASEIQAVATRLLGRTQAGSRPVRGLGIQLARMTSEGERDRQLDLFSPPR